MLPLIFVSKNMCIPLPTIILVISVCYKRCVFILYDMKNTLASITVPNKRYGSRQNDAEVKRKLRAMEQTHKDRLRPLKGPAVRQTEYYKDATNDNFSKWKEEVRIAVKKPNAPKR